MSARLRVGAVVPVYNERSHIGGVLDKFAPGLVDEVAAVDDGSDDGTTEEIRKRPVTCLRHETRTGLGAAIRTGLKHLAARGLDVAVVMAGNGKDDPREIPKLVAPIQAGEADYVQGSRFFEGRGSFKNLPLSRYLMIRSYSAALSLLYGFQWTDATNGFRAYKLEIVKRPELKLDQGWLDSYELEAYINYKALTLGYRFREVAVSKDYPTRINYTKMRPVLDWWKMIRPLVLLRLGLKS